MSSQFPHDQAWGNQNHPHTHRPHNVVPGSGVEDVSQGSWAPQYQSQPSYIQTQQQTYLNNNVGAKQSPHTTPTPHNSWNRAPTQVNAFQQQPTVSYNPNAFPYPPQSATPTSYSNQYLQQPMFVPQPSYQPPTQQTAPIPPSHPAGNEDPWGWGWDESGSDSPATSTPNNNWGTSTPASQTSAFGSVQNYFQPCNAQLRLAPPGPSTDTSQETKKEISALSVENFATVESGGDVSVQSDSIHSYQTGSVPQAEPKSEGSPEPEKIPLTTQALREFHQEAYENGPSVHRLGAEGLTPQWSIESQMSQETMSDDVSPSLAGASDVDATPIRQEEVIQPLYTPRRADEREQRGPLRLDEAEQQYRQELLPQEYQPREEERRYQSVRTDLYPDPEMQSRFSSLTLVDGDSENKEVISPEQQRAMNVAVGCGDDLVDGSGRYNQGSFSNSLRPDVEVSNDVRGLNALGRGDGSSSPGPPQSPLDARNRPSECTLPPGPPLSGFKTEKKSPSPRPVVASVPPSSRPPEGFGHSRPVILHTARPESHQISGQAETYRQPDVIYAPATVMYSPRGSEESQTHSQGSRLPEQYNFSPKPVDEQLTPTAVASRSLDPRNFSRPTEDSVNLETIPDNKERPDLEMRSGRFPQQGSWYGTGPDNLEIAPRGDRNQYLETGQLAEQEQDHSLNEAGGDMEVGETLPPPGLSRLVTGEGHNIDMINDNSTPPPGLDRMVLGQLTEGEQPQASIALHGTPPPAGLHRMVVGQLTDDPGGFPRMVPGESSSPDNQVQSSSSANGRETRQRGSGYPRMVPGESSSPASQVSQPPATDGRVVTGVAREDTPATLLPVASSPVGRRQSLSESPDPQNRNQPQAERCETIGSDHVEAFIANPQENSSKIAKRRDKERHREDLSSDEHDSGRRLRDDDYYRERDRARDESPRGDRRRVDGNRRRRHSPQRHRDYRDDRDDRRRRRNYDYSDDEDADTGGYYSDRERRNMSGYRDDYDRTFPRRDDRARSLRPEKSTRDRTDDRRDGKDKRRGYDRGRDRDREREARHSDYYRRRGPDDAEDYQRSRPSSRNESSVHDFKQRGLSGRGEVDRDNERDPYRSHSKRDRDIYYPPYSSGTYNYDPAIYNNYYQQYHYYENLRRTNPAAYAEFYRKYYVSSHQGTYSEDRGSVHSGRSSANEDGKDRVVDSKKRFVGPPVQLLHPYYLPSSAHAMMGPSSMPHTMSLGVVYPARSLDTSLLPGEPQQPQRLTPTKFTTAHVKGVLTAHGQFIKILPHYPMDGQPASIEIHEGLTCYQASRSQLQEFPGPLVKGITHKNNVVRYCKQKIRDADTNPDIFDKDSYKLIWELLILLLRQNGTVVGTDIAELLMSHRSAHQPPPSPATSHHSINEIPGQQTMQEEELTNKFRDLLIYGNTKEALEWAMKHGLWGHALFLASKMDQRTYASVMARFANGLPLNDPLQTLYQLMSGRQPAAVTCCLDERWGDWRPHLAMILSNTSARPELDHRAIAALGDTLGSRGSLHAAHFCYLMAQLEFGSFAHKSSKLVLIGSSHTLPFHQFATNEAIFATEIFEFACNLADTEFVLHHLQVYKLLVAKRLAEVGMTQEAVHYVEVIANTIMKQPSLYPAHLIQEVYDFGDLLKFSDPIYISSESGGADPPWLSQLLPVLADYQAGVLQHHAGFRGSISNLTSFSEPDGQPNLQLDTMEQKWQQSEPLQQPQQQQQHYQQLQPKWSLEPQQQQWIQDSQLLSQPESFTDPPTVDPPTFAGSGTDTPNYWTPPPASQWQQPADLETVPSPGASSGNNVSQIPTPDYFDPNRSEAPLTISLPGASPRRARTTSQSSDVPRAPQTSPPHSKEPPHPQQQGSGWLGGFWSKLSLKPKNQMILPDDKNPSIVWDPDKKRWVDQNSGDDDAGVALPPPPMASPRVATPLTANTVPTPPSANATLPKPPSAGPNLYKMPRGKNLRANYVDVMNPSGQSQQPPTVPAPDLFPSLSYSNHQPAKLFVPAPVESPEGGLNLFNPSAAAPQDIRDTPLTQGLSRWSSTSSLSREVQKYTNRARARFQVGAGPMTLSDGFPNGRWNNGTMGATLPRTKQYN